MPFFAGKVYNITPYMKFHPGGVEDLMKSAGKDATILFDEVQQWYTLARLYNHAVFTA